MTRDTIFSAVKLSVLLGGGGEACFRMEAEETWFWTTYCLKACMQDSLCSWRHEVPYNWHILGFFSLCLNSFCANELHHTQHISGFWYNLGSCAKTLALKTLLDQGCCPKLLCRLGLLLLNGNKM